MAPGTPRQWQEGSEWARSRCSWRLTTHCLLLTPSITGGKGWPSSEMLGLRSGARGSWEVRGYPTLPGMQIPTSVRLKALEVALWKQTKREESQLELTSMLVPRCGFLVGSCCSVLSSLWCLTSLPRLPGREPRAARALSCSTSGLSELGRRYFLTLEI